MSLDEVVTEIGSQTNAKRRKSARVSADATAAAIVVEH